MIPQLTINNPIVIGNDWSQEFQPTTIYDGVDSGSSQITSSDTSNPCLVKTILPHNLSAGKVCIDGHTPNTVINGNQNILIVDKFTVSVTGVTGQIAGGATGIIEQIINANTFTSFTVAVKQYVGGAALTNPIVTLSWNDQSIFDFTLTIDEDESAKIIWQSSPLIFTVSWLDGSGNKDSIDIQIPVTNA